MEELASGADIVKIITKSAEQVSSSPNYQNEMLLKAAKDILETDIATITTILDMEELYKLQANANTTIIDDNDFFEIG